MKKSELALLHFREFIHLKDSLFSIDQSKELVRQELEFNFARKQEQQRIKQEKKEERSRQESQRQRNIIFGSLSALVLLSFLLGFSIWQYRQKNRSKLQLEIANVELNSKNVELEQSKEIIELQHREITDSIHYARQIQQAVLPSQTDLNEYFNEASVIFAPKDVISGDFYWATSIGDVTILATVDCTGHGVPGGFMSMLGISLLNELVIEQGLTSPAVLLHRLREKVIASLRQKGKEGEQKDGMDMTICVFDHKNMTLTYGVANHVFYHVSEGEITECKGDRQPVGIFGDELLPFHEFSIQLKKGDRIFTFTDGYPDQFGGPRGKKFKYQQLKELVSSSSDMDLKVQVEMLEHSFVNWKGKLEQTDDVTLIGIRI
jgi:serine phosphatase RsbU (regulator of sigma subunit)